MEHFINQVNKVIVEHWDERALSDFRKERFTHAQVGSRIIREQLIYSAIGVGKGDKIALCGKNSARWATAFLAATTYHAVAVPILYDFTPENVCDLAAHSDARIVYTEAKIFEKWDLEKLPQMLACVSLDDFSLIWARTEEIKAAYDNIEKVIGEKYPEGIKASDFHVEGLDMDELSVINYTSGTTGTPKGIMLTARSISANNDYAQRTLPIPAGSACVSMLPMAHMYGLAFEFLYKFCDNCEVYFLGKTPSPSVLMAAFAELHPWQIITVPLVIEKIIKGKVLPILEKPVMKVLTSIPGIRQILNKVILKKVMGAFGGNCYEIILGGAAVSAPIEKVLRELKFPYTVGYGMTECGPLVAYEHHEQFAPGSCGKVVDCAQIRVADANPETGIGELQVKGENVMVGYYKNPEATAAAFTEDGWLRTGDLGIIDAEGNIFIKGRSKCMILSASGQNVYPEEIEAILNNLPYISESLVLARDKNIIGIVTLNAAGEEAIKGGKSVDDILLETTKALNAVLPNYSQVNKLELLQGEFVHTPKMSIKRSLYK
ncbi:MAG: AMP-binding protein [Bacteroidales bacterium]|nr:AMP-binding protein [Bacteroidales bacterium]